jgi:hypothetical protein
MKNSFKIQTLPCMVSLLGKSQTFKIGDRIEIYNTITKEIAYLATIVGEVTVKNDQGYIIGNSLRSAKLIS